MESSVGRTKAPRRGAYLLPSFFTGINILCGFLALTETFQAGELVPGSLSEAAKHFDLAAIAIGLAVLFDGIDGRIARLMGLTSAFGREFDSIADAITFGIAPAFLAFAWGVRAVLPVPGDTLFGHLTAAGWWVSFIFVICSASRLARFNIQTTPTASNYQRQDRKSFVGLPTPAAAGLVASFVHFNSGFPVGDWLWVPFWLLMLLATSLLMVSTWRYSSFKDLDLRRKQKFVVVIGVAGAVALIYLYSQWVLLLIATSYLLSGVLAKLSQTYRRGRIDVLSDLHSSARTSQRPEERHISPPL